MRGRPGYFYPVRSLLPPFPIFNRDPQSDCPRVLSSTEAVLSRRMQSGCDVVAEDSCFIKHHSKIENEPTIEPTDTASKDVEKAQVKSSDAPATENSVVGLQDLQFSAEKGLGVDNQDSGHSTDSSHDEKGDFPEGGFKAWSVVVGCFCGSFSVFGIINSTAVLLDYFQTHQLKDKDASQIGWIFGLALFLTFFCGGPVGPIFDAYGPRALLAAGSVLLVLSMFLLGLCTQYWHFIMVYSVLNGLGGALIVPPCTASIGHYFQAKRGNATGVAMTAGSIGGVIFPLMLQKLFPQVGFAWGTRILGFLIAFLLILANMLIKSRIHKPLLSVRDVLPVFSAYKNPVFTLVAVGVFLMEWGIFVPLTYITSYATSHGHSTAFGFQILAVLNAGSIFGRFFAGLVADTMGRVNTLILSITLCIISCFALWLPAGESTAMLVVFALVFGFVSGSNLSLSPVCIGQTCETKDYGKYFSTAWILVSFGTLSGLPIAGQILTVQKGDYTGLIIFAGCSYIAAALCLITARVYKVGWKWNEKY